MCMSTLLVTLVMRLVYALGEISDVPRIPNFELIPSMHYIRVSALYRACNTTVEMLSP